MTSEGADMPGALIGILLLMTVVGIAITALAASRIQKLVSTREKELHFERIKATTVAQRILKEFRSFMENTSPYVYSDTQINVSVRVERHGLWPWQKHCAIFFSFGLKYANHKEELDECITDFLSDYLSNSSETKFRIVLYFYLSKVQNRVVFLSV